MKQRRKTKSEVNPEELQLFKELCDAVKELGIETRVEKGNFRGGMCTVEGDKEMLFINKKHAVDSRIALVISELKKQNDLQNNLPEDLKAKIKAWF